MANRPKGEEHRAEEGTEVAHAKAEQEISQKQQSAEQQPERKTAPKILFKFVPELLPQKHIALAHDPVFLNAFFQQFHIRLFLQALVQHFDFT